MPSDNKNPNTENSSTTVKNSPAKLSWRKRIWHHIKEDVITKPLEVILTIATVLLACYTYELWDATNGLLKSDKEKSEQATKDMVESLRLTKQAVEIAASQAQATIKQAEAAVIFARTAESQSRAYITLDISLKNYPSPQNKADRIAFALDIANSGKTWPRNLTIKKEIVTLEKGDSKNPFESVNWESIAASYMTISPGQAIPIQFTEIKLSKTQQIINGNYQYFFVAIAKYEDTVGQSTVIRQTQINRLLRMGADGSISFSYLPTHNCADDNCKKYKYQPSH